MDLNNKSVLHIFLTWGDAGYDVRDIQEKMVNNRMVEAVIDYKRSEDNEYYGDELNSDWDYIVDLAHRENYVVLPVEDKSDDEKIVRLIDRDLLSPVRKDLNQLLIRSKNHYWAIQGDVQCHSFSKELEMLVELNAGFDDAIRDIAIMRRNRFLFNRNYHGIPWDKYKSRLKNLGAQVKRMEFNKVPFELRERLIQLSDLYCI